MNPAIPKVSHYGVVKFGEIECEAVVLESGERGFVQRQFVKALGFKGNIRVLQIRRFLGDFAPKALNELDKSGSSKVLMPHGGCAAFFPATAVTETVTGVIRAGVDGELHAKQRPALDACLRIQESMASVGLVALIDEATGYQHHRAPDALQELLNRLLRQSCANWERRFHPNYYKAIYSLFGWKYIGHDKGNPPHVVGNITMRWVYGPVFPPEIIGEIRAREGFSDRHHQWLTDQGLAQLDSQIHAVTAIARGSQNYRDFTRRCAAAFGGGFQLDLLDGEELLEAA